MLSLWAIGINIVCVTIIIITIVLITVPGTVTNIRAYVYKPTRGSDDLTALVLWDEPQFMVSNYIVSMFQNGQQLYSPVSYHTVIKPFILLYSNDFTYLIAM